MDGGVKTVHRFDWNDGDTIVKTLSRSFDTLEEAVRFSQGKRTTDIYKSKGKYRVEWLKISDNN